MPPAADHITLDELLAVTDRLRLDVSERQLERWRKWNLLPPPTRRFLGRGRGTESRYPTEALPRVLSITWFLQAHPGLEDVRWAQWCFGFDVTADVRRDLIDRLDGWEAELREGYADFKSGLKGNPITALAFERAPRWFGSIRRRIRKQRAETLACLMVELLLGRLHDAKPGERGLIRGYENDDLQIVLDALEAASPSDEVARLLKGLLPIVPGVLELLSECASLPAIRALIQSLTDEDLCTLRDEGQTIWGWFLSEVMKEGKQPAEKRGRVYWGRRKVSATVRWDRAFMPSDAFFAWVVLRRCPLFAEWSYELLNRPGVPAPQPPPIARVARRRSEALRRHRRRSRRSRRSEGVQ